MAEPRKTTGTEGTWRVTCPEHRLDRAGLSEAHADNLLAKHLREWHNVTEEWPDLNLSAVASLVCMAATLDGITNEDDTPLERVGTLSATVLGMWESLTGLPRAEAVALAQRVQASREPITAAVVPF